MRVPGLILLALSLALPALLQGCPAGEVQQTVTVYNRCGDLNFEDLKGDFGRLDGGSSINGKFRIRFTSVGGPITAKYVGGEVERFALRGTKTGAETMTFDEIGGPVDASGRKRRIKASLTTDCRLQLEHSWVRGETESKVPAQAGPESYVRYLELDRLDFEPCSEPLYLRSAAKQRDKATGGTIRPAAPAPVTEDRLPMGAFSPASEIAAGCRPTLDVWLDGEAVAIDAGVDPAEGGFIHWLYEYETQYLGVHHVAMHRKSVCDAGTEILGVACTEIEIK
jgi:hypothetical protein